MKQRILDFLKTFSFNLPHFLESGLWYGECKLVSEELRNDSVDISYFIERNNNQIDVFIYSNKKSKDFTIFDEFTKKLIKQISKEKSENRVIESQRNKKWYSWNSSDGSANFALKNEPVLFEARFSFNKI